MKTTGKFPLMPAQAAILALLILSGFLINCFPISLFFRVDFIFGSIATMIVISLFGWGWGVVCALISSSYICYQWGSLVSIIIFCMEALFVGLLLRRRRANLILVDALFWLVLGIPLAWILYHGFIGMDQLASTTIALKQSINGIFNALVASLVLTAYPTRGKSRFAVLKPRPSLDLILFNLVVAVVLIPAMVNLIRYGRKGLQQLEVGLRSRLEAVSSGTGEDLAFWSRLHLNSVQSLAAFSSSLELKPSKPLQDAVEIFARTSPDFHNMYVADRQARTVAFSPPVNEKGESTIGIQFSDRGYFHQLLATRRAVISDVILGRGGVFTPIITISAPIFKKGAFAGYALGAVKLSQIKAFLRHRRERGLQMSLFDRHGRVIASTIPGIRPMQYVEWHRSGRVKRLGENFYRWEPTNGVPSGLNGVNAAFYVMETSSTGGLPWRLTLRFPVMPLRNQLFTAYRQSFLTTLIFAAIAILLAVAVSRRIGEPLSRLAAATRNLPERILSRESIEWPAAGIAEVHHLISNFQRMDRSLRESFWEVQSQTGKLAALNRELEAEIGIRKRAEESLRAGERFLNAVVETSPALIYLTNLDGNILLFNRACEELSGYEREQVLGKSIDELVAPSEREGDAGRSPSESAGSEDMMLRQERWLTHSGEEKLIEWRYADLLSPETLEHFTLGIGIDVTERSRMEEQAQQQSALAAIGQLAAGIAHDFNNLLTVILGLSSMLEMRSDLPEQVKEDIRTIYAQGERASNLTRQILDFSRATVVDFRPIDMVSLLKESIKLLERTFPENIHIETHFMKDEQWVEGNLTQLQQVITNLAVNARDAMPGGGTLKVVLEHLEVGEKEPPPLPGMEPGKWCCWSLSDTGTGMPQKVLTHIFEPFFTTKPPGQGTGLGMSQVYGIVKQHNGEIKVESQVGKGTSFKIYLPALKREERRFEESLSGPQEGRGEAVLVVEDEEVVLDVVTNMLDLLNYRVVPAQDGNQALQQFEAHADEISLVITDTVMPEMGGYELMRKLRRKDPDLPIILMSGYPIGDSNENLPAGATRMLEKPLDLERLATTVGELLIHV